jgi:hypothetical protein
MQTEPSPPPPCPPESTFDESTGQCMLIEPPQGDSEGDSSSDSEYDEPFE